jgi:potassium efflux system protein
VILKQFTNLPKLVLVLCLALWGMSGVAQSTSGSTPDYERWAATASMAQDTLASGTATEDFLTKLRAQLTLRRSEFVAAQDADTARLNNLRIQLSALGPRPDDGVELVDIASRRKELSTEIEVLNAPRIRAKEAFERADGVIREIDAALSTQQAENLMRLRVSPLDVRIWPAAIVQLVEQFKAIANGVSTAWNTPMVQDKVRDKMPLIIALLVIAALLLTQGRRWMGQVALTFRRHGDTYAVEFASYLRSLGQLIITILSLYLITRAWDISRLYDNNLALLLGNMIWVFAPFIISIWVAKRLFPKEEQAKSPVSLQASLRPQARTLTQFLGLILSAELLMKTVQKPSDFTDGTIAVYTFILVLMASAAAFRIGVVLWTKTTGATDGQAVTKVPLGLIVRIGQALVVVAAISLILALVGYSDAAVGLLFPSLLSVGFLAVLFITFEAMRDLCAMLSSDEAEGHDSLTAVMINAALTLISLPVFAIIWGARVSQLTELWTQFKTGVTLGDVQLSPGAVVELIIVFVIGLLFTRLIQRTLKTRILAKTKVDLGGQNAIVSGVGYLGIFIAALTAITSAGLDLSSLAIVAGALSVGIGFGLQNIVSNFVSGIILLIERPISVGDWIEVGGNMGIVSKISVRSTSIQTFDRTDVIVPNADLVSGTVTNYTHGSSVGRIILPIGVAYGNDTRKVEEILKPLAAAHPMVLLDPAPSVVFKGFGADSLDFEIRALLSDINSGLSVKTELNHQIAEALTANGIEIPFAQRDIWIRNPEALVPNSPKSG